MEIEQLDVLSDDGLDLPPSEEIHREDSIRQCSSMPTLAIPAPNMLIGRGRFIHPDGNRIFYAILIPRNLGRSREW
jgi:hypothetical protein